MSARRPLAAVAALACAGALVPATAGAQSSGAGTYVETVPGGGGSRVTATPRQESRRSGPTHHAASAPATTQAPAPSSSRSSGTSSPSTAAPAAPRQHPARHARRRRARKHAARPHAKPLTAPVRAAVPAAASGGGSHGFVWLGVAMAVVTVMVLGGAGYQRRRAASRT